MQVDARCVISLGVGREPVGRERGARTGFVVERIGEHFDGAVGVRENVLGTRLERRPPSTGPRWCQADTS